MTTVMRFFSCVILCVGSVAWAQGASTKPLPPAHDAKQVLLLDMTSGVTLFEQNADELVPPSSMSKMMTVYTVFQQLKNKTLSLDDRFTVSRKAWKMGGSRMFLKYNSSVSVRDLIRGVIVQSGNDAAVTLAEGVAGSEDAFVSMMQDSARKIGITKGRVVNATGWPDLNHLLTARELGRVAERTIRDFPEYYAYYSERDMTYNGIRQINRNPLLYHPIGCDGLKTGNTDAGGYGLTASARQGHRRLLLVINGCASKKKRAQTAKTLMTWGFRAFQTPLFFTKGSDVGEIDVWLGEKTALTLIAKSDIVMTVGSGQVSNLKAEIVYQGPVEAPIKRGDEVAQLVITNSATGAVKEFPLAAKGDVHQIGIMGRIVAAVRYLLFGS